MINFDFHFPPKDPSIKKILARSQKIALQTGPVLIEGETGTGKSVLAKYIHASSKRSDISPRIHGCGEFNSGTIKSSFFGHIKGAFTGAVTGKEGILSAANGSTLVLDDIDCLNLEHQNLLLRFLDDGIFHKVGDSEKSISVNARVICTTNKNLDAFADSGQFLSDLLFRLRQWSIVVPPLRKRKDSIEFFASLFLKEFQHKNPDLTDEKTPWRFDSQAIEFFKALPWPGNLRQLRRAVDNIALFAEGSRCPITLQECIEILFDEEMPVLCSPVRKNETDHQKLLRILNVTAWNIKMAHRITGLSRTTIYKRIDENGWQRPPGMSRI